MSKITIARVYRVTDGSPLLADITAGSPATGGNLGVEAVTDFDPVADGETRYAVIDSEQIAYTDIDETTDELVNITRGANGTTPAGHTAGTFVQAGLTPKTEKFADGFIDDDEALAQGVEILRHLWRYYPTGDRDHDEMELSTVRYLDDDHPVIIDAPITDQEYAEGSPVVVVWSKTGAIVTGVRPHQVPSPCSGTIEEVRLALGENGEADDDVVADALVDGASILTTKMEVATGQSLSAAVEPTTKEVVKGALLQVEFESAGATLVGYDPVVYFTIWPSANAQIPRIEVPGPQGEPGQDGLISEVQDDGTPVTDAGTMDFTGDGVSVTSDGTVITVDIPQGGTPYVGMFPAFHTGLFYATPGAIGTLQAINGEMRLGPFIVPDTTTFDRIAIDVTVAGSTNSVARLGIYSDNNGAPGALVLDAGTVATTSTGLKTITISQALNPGVYWLAYAAQGSPTTQPTVRAIPSVIQGFALPAATTATSVHYVAGITGALPTPAGSTLTASGAGPARVLLRAA